MAKEDEKVIIWKNTQEGNNHSLVHQGDRLTLTIVKPDGVTFKQSRETKSTAEQWLSAIQVQASQWCQSHTDDTDGFFLSVRTIRTDTGELAVWKVDHYKADEEAQYELNDGFVIM